MAVEALEFYGKKENWVAFTHSDGNHGSSIAGVDMEKICSDGRPYGGKRARAALAKMKEL